MAKMSYERDNEIILKGLNVLHRDILLGDTEAQEADIETLVQLTRYFGRKSGWSTLAEEAENLKRAVDFLSAGGELKSCRFPAAEELPKQRVERFSAFGCCYDALCQSIREGKDAFCICYDETKETLAVKVMSLE